MDTEKIVRWETPLSEAKSLALVSLLDQNGLHLVFQDLRDSDCRRYRFTFRKVAAFRSTLEEYRLSEDDGNRENGWTRQAKNSQWLRNLKKSEPLFEVHSAGCRHYLIATEDDVVEIICPNPPEICEIEQAESDEADPGKSRILYHPEDREAIDSALAKATGRRKTSGPISSEHSRNEWGKRLTIAERVAHVLVMLVGLDAVADTLITFATPVSHVEVQNELIEVAIWHSIPIVGLGLFLLLSSLLRSRMNKQNFSGNLEA